MVRWTLVTATLLLAACASAPQVAPPPVEPAAPPPVVAPQPAPVEPQPPALPNDIHWVRNSAEYPAALRQTYRLASERLPERVGSREPGTWAVAVDADETLISNSEQSKEHFDATISFEEAWDEWVERRAATALPGAAEFLALVRELGGHIAVVTNRRDRHCPQTADNLRALELPFDVILCRTDEHSKEARWRMVEQGTADPALPPLEIVMWVGDNIHDFPGLDQMLRFAPADAYRELGDRFFILPNPMYGSWEDNPPD